jgi:serine/threonine protein kinase
MEDVSIKGGIIDNIFLKFNDIDDFNKVKNLAIENSIINNIGYWPQSLNKIYINDCRIENDLPPFPPDLKKLTINNSELNDNQIDIKKNSLIEELCLENNNLKKIPFSKNLKYLNLKGNQLSLDFYELQKINKFLNILYFDSNNTVLQKILENKPYNTLGCGTYCNIYGTKKDYNWAVKIPKTTHNNLYKREIEIMKKLKDIDEISDIYDFDESLNIIIMKRYLTDMEHLKCSNIKNFRYVFYRLAKAVKTMHDNNIIHRDIKPGNIVVDKLGKTYLTDFNGATFFETAENVIQTIDEGIVNYNNFKYTHNCTTFNYASPEMISGFVYNYKTDIWSIAISMIQIFNNETITFFQDKDDNNEPLYFIKNSKNKIYGLINNFKANVIKPSKLFFGNPPPILVDLIDKMTIKNFKYRININEVLEHDFFYYL